MTLRSVHHSHLLEEGAKASWRVLFGAIRVNATASCQPSLKHSAIGKVQGRLKAIDVDALYWLHLYTQIRGINGNGNTMCLPVHAKQHVLYLQKLPYLWFPVLCCP